MKRLHLVMLLVVMIFAGIFIGNMFGGRRGAYAGCGVGVVMLGAFLWANAPREFQRRIEALHRKGVQVQNLDEARAQFLRGVRTAAVGLMALGVAGVVAALCMRL